jgi:hypothetical protein
VSDRTLISKLAGGAAVASALLFIVSLKVSDPLANALTAAWNLLLLPAAAVLWWWLRPRSPLLIDSASAAGVAATLLWAAATVTGWWRLEPVWIALAMAWWFVVGWFMRRAWKWFGWATLILGVAAALDLAVTLLETANTDWFFLGAVKLPLSMLWSGWLGVLLITRTPTCRSA